MIDYLIMPQHRLIFVWGRGETSVRECIECIERLHADSEHSRDYDAISDVTELSTNLSGQELLEIIHFYEAISRGTRQTKNAIIAPLDRTYAQSRMYEQLSEGVIPYETAVFRNRQSALEWLGKDPEAIMAQLVSG